jgi:hypothetical protein
MENRQGKNTRGRNPLPKEEKVLNNGFLPRQWIWLTRRSKAKHMEAMPFVRLIVDEYIASVEAEEEDILMSSNIEKKKE